jgi:hypothetical protein
MRATSTITGGLLFWIHCNELWRGALVEIKKPFWRKHK